MDYYSYCLKHCYYWLHGMWMPSYKVFVACVDRKICYGTPRIRIIQQYAQPSSSISVTVRVRSVVVAVVVVVVVVVVVIVVVASIVVILLAVPVVLLVVVVYE